MTVNEVDLTPEECIKYANNSLEYVQINSQSGPISVPLKLSDS